MSLLDNLVSHWKLDETSGTRVDSHGSNDLTDSGSTGSESGPLGTAALFVGTTRLFHTDNAELSPSSSGFHMSALVKMDEITLNEYRIFGKAGGFFPLDGFMLRYQGSEFSIDDWTSNIGDGSTTYEAVTSGSPAVVDTWYLVQLWWDAADSKLRLQINNGTPLVSGTTSNVPMSEGNDFVLGGTGSLTQHVGAIQSVSFWNGRILTADERNELWNNGDFLSYDDFAPAISYSPVGSQLQFGTRARRG